MKITIDQIMQKHPCMSREDVEERFLNAGVKELDLKTLIETEAADLDEKEWILNKFPGLLEDLSHIENAIKEVIKPFDALIPYMESIFPGCILFREMSELVHQGDIKGAYNLLDVFESDPLFRNADALELGSNDWGKSPEMFFWDCDYDDVEDLIGGISEDVYNHTFDVVSMILYPEVSPLFEKIVERVRDSYRRNK